MVGAWRFLHKGQPDPAIDDFDHAILLNPNYAEAFYDRGLAYNGKGQPDRAIEDFDHAILLNPNYAEAFHTRGVAYDDKGQHDRAIKDYDQAIRLNPNYADAFVGRGVVYTRKGQPDLAIEDFDHAIGSTRLLPRHSTTEAMFTTPRANTTWPLRTSTGLSNLTRITPLP